MLSILKKPTPVEVIHAEFDSAQDRILDECDKILAELKIPTETQIEKKANMLKELGFVNSETVHQANSLQEKAKKIENQINLTQSQAELIRYFKYKYPFDKFITIDELEKICTKYDLIHAPAQNYVKDIPEKNVLEMKNRRQLDSTDQIPELFHVDEVNGKEEFKKFLKVLGKNKPEFTNDEVLELHRIYRGYINHGVKSWVFGGTSDYMVFYDAKTALNFDFGIKSYSKVDRSGLFIAAPKSHFNLGGLTKKSKFGFFNVTVQEVKDPVVFEYCKNDICRIITKWGTEDDQSYLDPSLINETLN